MRLKNGLVSFTLLVVSMNTVMLVETAEDFLENITKDLAGHPIHTSLFLEQFKSRKLSPQQLRAFGIQWLKTTRSHKLAFPALIANITDDDTRFELIDILYEEYGAGNREKIHARLLEKFLFALQISSADIEHTTALPEVATFAEELAEIWKNENDVMALGLHFALEHLASTLMPTVAEGLRQYPELTEDDREYFTFHSSAETRHAHYAYAGVLRYAQENEGNRAELAAGVHKGIWLMENLYNGFLRCINERSSDYSHDGYAPLAP